jgi:hypothetical protein
MAARRNFRRTQWVVAVTIDALKFATARFHRDLRVRLRFQQIFRIDAGFGRLRHHERRVHCKLSGSSSFGVLAKTNICGTPFLLRYFDVARFVDVPIDPTTARTSSLLIYPASRSGSSCAPAALGLQSPTARESSGLTMPGPIRSRPKCPAVGPGRTDSARLRSYRGHRPYVPLLRAPGELTRNSPGLRTG